MPHINKDMISFFITTKCNLSCVYCYNSNERQKLKHSTLSLDFAKLGIDHYFTTSPSRHIRFYGPGEPTQELDLIRKIKEYAEERDNTHNVTSEIQTNGAFSRDCSEWLAKNINYIWISFDGPPDIQNYNRPFVSGADTSPVIENNVRIMFENRTLDDGVIGARITMSNNNIHRQIEMIDYFLSLGIRYLWTDAMFPSVEKRPFCESEDRKTQFDFDMETYAEEFIVAYNYAKEKDVFYGSFLMCNFDGSTNRFCRACIPSPHLTSDGYVSACDLAIFGENAYHMDPFIYGKHDDINNNIIFNDRKIAYLKCRKTENMPICAKCDVANHCAGYCLGEILNETGSIFGQKSHTCNAIKKLAHNIGFFDKEYDFYHP